VGTAISFWKGLSADTTDTAPFVTMAVDTLSIVIHACGVERINKNHQMVHCKQRAGFGEENTVKALFCFTNLRLSNRKATKHIDFKQWCASSLSEVELEDISETLSWEFHEDSAVLPATRDGEDFDSDESVMDEAEEDEDEDDADLQFVVPEYFVLVEKPEALLSGKDLKGIYVHMMWAARNGDLIGWETGKIKKYAPKRIRHNYDVMWDDGLRGSMLTLETYYCGGEVDALKGGEWVYIRRA
jgi:hypothetical protein